eukprot:Gb_40719 [translate_table: standard]
MSRPLYVRKFLVLVDEVILEQRKAHILHLLADFEITSEKRPKNRNKISIVILEALCKTTSLSIQCLELEKERIGLALEPPVEHHSVHNIIHH